MSSKHKTIGPRLATVLTSMYDANKRVFSVEDAAAVLHTDRRIASNLLQRAAEKGVLTRMQAGIYSIVPSELGSETTYIGDPYVIGAAIMRGRPYYISHGSALSLHELTTQPWLMVVIATPIPMHSRRLHGTKFHFVRIPERRLFGTKAHWVAGAQQVIVSDVEKTIADCLTEPQYCGGYSEIDKAAWIAKSRLDADKLVDYALRLRRGAVVARMGFLLDSCQIGHEGHREALRRELSKAYNMLDPTLPHEGPFMSKWRLRVNTSLEELTAARTT